MYLHNDTESSLVFNLFLNLGHTLQMAEYLWNPKNNNWVADTILLCIIFYICYFVFNIIGIPNKLICISIFIPYLYVIIIYNMPIKI